MRQRFVSGAIAALAFVSIFTAGCSKSDRPQASNSGPSPAMSGGPAATIPNSASVATLSDQDSIKAAIASHLRSNTGINMAAMDTSVDSVSMAGDQAQANVVFRLKQGGTSMLMTYFLERHADGWIVLRSQPSGGQFSHPPLDQIHSGAAAPTNPAVDQAPPDVSSWLRRLPPSRRKASQGASPSPVP